MRTYYPVIPTTSVPNKTMIHTEHYSDLWYTNSYYFQYNIQLQKFTKHVNNQLICNKNQNSFNNSWDDVHDEWFIFQKYDFLTARSFSTFFNTHQIDVPSCFANSSSLLRVHRELSIVSLITYFMRHGQRLQTQSHLLKAVNHFSFTNPNHLNSINTSALTWKTIYSTLQTLYVTTPNRYLTASTFNNFTTPNSHYLLPNSKQIQTNMHLFNFLSKSLNDLQPLFSFYIYKVDKKIFKNTRGKSGKFTFIWKYIAPYKRLAWVMYWLAKEIKLKPGKTLVQRLSLLFNDLLRSPEKTWVFKVKRFSYNYVYRNCRTTLAETYRTTTK